MEKTRDLFKKIRDTKGIFHARMGSIKDRNGMDLTEAEDIKKWWQEYTEELYKKDLHDPDNHNGVITHLEPDILECEVKWALESITTNKASGHDGIPVELFEILKDDAVEVLHSICQEIWKTQHWSLRKAFLSLLAILWNSAFKWECLSFSPLLFTFLFTAICKVLLRQPFCLFAFLFHGDVLDPCILYNVTNLCL